METFLSFLLRGLLLFSVAISSTVAAPTSAADAAVTVLAPKQISRSELTQLIKRGGPNGIPPLAEARAAIAPTSSAAATASIALAPVSPMCVVP